MNRYLKFAIVFGALIVGLVFVAPAEALIVVPPDGGSFQLETTLADWRDNGPILQQDKLWTFQQTTLLDTTSLHLELNTPGPSFNERHSIQLGFDPQLVGTLENLNYQISIVNSPGRTFLSASLDSDSGGTTGTLVTKDIFAVDPTTPGALPILTLVSADGNPVSDQLLLPAGLTTIWIQESFDTTAGGALSGATNTFIQVAPIPEPGTLAIWSLLGAAALGGAWLRRRKTV